jgi:alginate O-acetyltransferase complex protein AlgI
VNFASRSFLLFLPAVLLAYHLLQGRRAKYGFLLAASWFFYAAWNPWYLWVLVGPTVLDYWAGRLIEGAPTPGRRRAWLALSVAVNLGFLAFFKYTDFLLGNGLSFARLMGWPAPDWALGVLLPLGISFHTFQGVSYTLDVYHGRVRAVRSFVDFALFVAFFPQLVAGPVVRAVEFLPQLAEPPRVTAAQVVEGLHLFVGGLFKKLVLADQLAAFVDPVFAHPAGYDGAALRWAVLAYAAQIYCDFSGYSDIAVGCAKWFGFELPLNFNFPYLAGNISAFWQRWHISLSAWLRDYVYIPLGGSRKGTLTTYRNLFVTFTLCGLWHGASWNYVLWGSFNGLLLMAHRAYDRAIGRSPSGERLRASAAYRLLAVPATVFQVLVGLVVVRSQSWAGCWRVERALVGWDAGPGGAAAPAWVVLLVCLFAAGHLAGGLHGRLRLPAWPPLVRATACAAAVALLVVFGAGSTKAFIYFQF